MCNCSLAAATKPRKPDICTTKQFFHCFIAHLFPENSSSIVEVSLMLFWVDFYVISADHSLFCYRIANQSVNLRVLIGSIRSKSAMRRFLDKWWVYARYYTLRYHWDSLIISYPQLSIVILGQVFRGKSVRMGGTQINYRFRGNFLYFIQIAANITQLQQISTASSRCSFLTWRRLNIFSQ